MNLKPCLYQIVRSNPLDLDDIDGIGDCSICTQSEDNLYCRMYTPVDVVYFNVGKQRGIRRVEVVEEVVRDGTVGWYEEDIER